MPAVCLRQLGFLVTDKLYGPDAATAKDEMPTGHLRPPPLKAGRCSSFKV